MDFDNACILCRSLRLTGCSSSGHHYFLKCSCLPPTLYQGSRLLLSRLRALISEITRAVGSHISSLASPVFGTSARIFRKFSKTSERIREGLYRSKHVSEPTKTLKNLRKLREKLRENLQMSRACHRCFLHRSVVRCGKEIQSNSKWM